MSPRFLYFDGTTNVRDIGGFVTEEGNRIKQGLAIRGAELDMNMVISDAGIKTMKEVLEIRTDIDLRGEAVGFTLKSPLGEDVNLVQIPIGAYEHYIEECNFEPIVRIFEVLADEKNYPVYFHCWGVADRTGCRAFTLEAVLGLCEEQLFQNFELTCLSNMGNIKSRDEKEFSIMVED